MKKPIFSLQRWALSALLLLALQSRAWAHAFLDHADPRVGSVIIASPAEMKLRFTQDIEPAFSSIKVENEKGSQVDKKDTHSDPKDKSLLVVSLPQLPSGTYTVTWHVVSVDTHKTQGHFEFTIK
jgi:hypothetical protein